MGFENFNAIPEMSQEPINIDGNEQVENPFETHEVERRISIAEDAITTITQDLKSIQTRYDSGRPKTPESEKSDEEYRLELEQSISRWNAILANLQNEKVFVQSIRDQWASHIFKGKGIETDLIQ